jgi:lipopolysaccharide biosynthesis glycosyltransferase
MQRISLVSTIDKNYLIPFKVFIKSLLKNNPCLNLDYNIFISDDITSYELNILRKYYPNFIFHEIKNSDYTNIEFLSMREWKFSPAYRLEIFKLRYNKIIYFDVDALCLRPIDEILSLDYSFAGIEHPLHDINQIKANYSFESNIGFNGGMLIIKEEHLNNKTIDELKHILKNNVWYGNQGPLNIFFKSKSTLVDKKYFLPTTEANLKTIKDAFFIHFLGEKKPWFEGSIKDKYSDQVLKYIDTPTVMKLQKIYDSYMSLIS